MLKNLGLAWCSGGFDSLPRPQITKKNKVMRIRISDKSLRDGELTLEVSNFLTTSQEMYFDLDNRWLGSFIATAVAKGMVKSAFRAAGASEWSVTMDIKYLTGLIYEV